MRITIEEYAERKGIHPETVRKNCRLGLYDAYKEGKRWRIDPDSTERVLALTQGNAAARQLAINA